MYCLSRCLSYLFLSNFSHLRFTFSRENLVIVETDVLARALSESAGNNRRIRRKTGNSTVSLKMNN